MPPQNPSLRVVLDSRGKVLSGPLMDTSLAPTLIFTSSEAPQTSLDVWQAKGVQVCIVPGGSSDDSPGLSLDTVLDELGQRGIIQVLIEGGAAVYAALPHLHTHTHTQFRFLNPHCLFNGVASVPTCVPPYNIVKCWTCCSS